MKIEVIGCLLAPIIYHLLSQSLGHVKAIVCLISLIIFYDFILKINDKLVQKAKLKENCEHGIAGGKTKNLCDQCKQKLLNELEEYNKKQNIKLKAIDLKAIEKEKLKQFKYKDLDYINSLSPQEFENYVTLLYRKLGYEVEQTPYTNDKGKDAIAYKNNVKYLIECKKYNKDKSIGRPMLQKFYAAMVEEKSKIGFFIATCSFTASAIEYGQKFGIELIDTEKLLNLINIAYPNNSELNYVNCMCFECGEIIQIAINDHETHHCSNGHPIKNDIHISCDSSKLICNKCGANMILKAGKHGKFWGCSKYPQCRNTKSYR